MDKDDIDPRETYAKIMIVHRDYNNLLPDTIYNWEYFYGKHLDNDSSEDLRRRIDWGELAII